MEKVTKQDRLWLKIYYNSKIVKQAHNCLRRIRSKTPLFVTKREIIILLNRITHRVRATLRNKKGQKD